MKFRIYINQISLRQGPIRRARLLLRRLVANRRIIHQAYYDKNAIFVHIPKVAGKSISTGLFETDKPGHYFISDYYQEDREFVRDAFSFAFMREPLERLSSAYYFLVSGGGNDRDKEFGEYLRERAPTFDSFVLDWLTEKRLYSWIHFIPQSDFLMLEGEVAVDYLADFTNLESSYKELMNRIPGATPLPLVNKTKVIKQSEFSVEVVGKVKSLYKRDFELYEKFS